MSILYIDDDAEDREIFLEVVRSIDEGIECVALCDGLEGLTYLEENKLPDVIVLDINMPMMNGITCLAEIKGNKETSQIPVAIFTTSNSRKEKDECKKLGAFQFIHKPSTEREMKEALTGLMGDIRKSLFA